MDYTNRQIGQYRARIQIGKGGFSTIWKAVHVKKASLKAAVKIMTPEALADKSLRGMFTREWKVVKDINHPGLLHYLESGYIDGIPFLTMDFFHGKTLRELIIEKSPLLRENFRKIFPMLADALYYLHSKTIIHRDIKPENILINDKLETKIIDFSIAQTRWQRLLDFSKRKIEGSPSYIAPEVLLGKASVPASDIYSLGAVAYEMLTGRPPFMGNSTREVMQQHVSAPPPHPRNLVKDLDPAIDKLVLSMLAKEPEIRPAGGEELLRRAKSLAQ